MSAPANLPSLPPSLKQLQHYLKTATEHDKRDPVIAYYCESWQACGGKAAPGNHPLFFYFNSFLFLYFIYFCFISFYFHYSRTCSFFWYIICITFCDSFVAVSISKSKFKPDCWIVYFFQDGGLSISRSLLGGRHFCIFLDRPGTWKRSGICVSPYLLSHLIYLIWILVLVSSSLDSGRIFFPFYS